MGLSGAASAQVVMDYIGPMDGTGIGTNIIANQDFEAAYDIYDAVVADSFSSAGGNINQVEMVLGGWNGFVDPSSVSGYTANIFSGSAAAAVSTTGDIASQLVDVANVTADPAWLGANFLMVVPTAINAIAGTNWLGVIPSNDFATGGQTGVADSLTSDGMAGFQANPGGGFGLPGNVQDLEDATGAPGHAALRAGSGAPIDPCSLPLADLCPTDVDGDGSVAVSDILEIIGQWGQCGDGTFRPSGDVAPLPNGDCCVTVADVLAVVGSWGADCTVYGACCYGDGMCDDNSDANSCAAGGGVYFGDGALCIDNTCVSGACCLDLTTCADMTADGCAASAGSYKGDGTACATTDCSNVIPGDECVAALVAIDGANPFDTTTMTADPNLPTCAADAGAFGWTVPVNDIWLMWTATNTNDYIIDTCDALSFDTSVVVYDACGGAEVACNGDAPADATCQIYHSALTLSATAGSTYYFRIGGYDAASIGAGTLNITEAAPGACCVGTACTDGMSSADCAAAGGSYFGSGSACATTDCNAAGGDECNDAIPVYDGANAFDTTNMTPSVEPVDDSQCAGTYLDWGTGNNDGWYMYVATGGMTTFDTCDAASFDTSIVLYEGDCATQVACNGDTANGTGCQSYSSGIENFDCVAGQTYYVRIGAWNAGAGGAGTLNITPPATGFGACCLNDGSCLDVDASNCVAFGGDFMGDQVLCSTSPCPNPYGGCPAGADMQCDACAVDGDDSSLDCNAGLNGPTGTEFQAIALGVPMCGTGSVFNDPNYDNGDGTFGATLRDMDWFTNASMNAGGTFTVTAASSGFELWIIVVDNVAGTIIDQVIIPGGIEGSLTFTVPAGDNSLVVAPNAWDLTWICGSGLENYTVLLN